jgi:hypothetical protein
MPQVAPKARNTAASGYSAPAFTGNSPGPKMTALWKKTSPTTTSARNRSRSLLRVAPPTCRASDLTGCLSIVGLPPCSTGSAVSSHGGQPVDRVARTLELRQGADPGPVGVHQVPVGHWPVAMEARVDDAAVRQPGDRSSPSAVWVSWR